MSSPKQNAMKGDWRSRSGSTSSVESSSSAASSRPSSSGSSVSSSTSWRRGSSASSSPPTSSHSRSSSGGSSSNNWWATSGSPSDTTLTPLVPSFEQLEPGMVLHLAEPTQDSILKKILVGTQSTPWNHPVVIVGKSQGSGEQVVEIRVCTSFGGRRLEAAREAKDHHQFILADNKEDTVPPTGSRVARLTTDSDPFSKRTYVCLRSHPVVKLLIEYKHLGPVGRRSVMRFDAESTQRIIHGCH